MDFLGPPETSQSVKRAEAAGPRCHQALSCSGLRALFSASLPAPALPDLARGQASPRPGGGAHAPSAGPTHSPAAPRVRGIYVFNCSFGFVADETMAKLHAQQSCLARAGGRAALSRPWLHCPPPVAGPLARPSQLSPAGGSPFSRWKLTPATAWVSWASPGQMFRLASLHGPARLQRGSTVGHHVWGFLRPPGWESSVLPAAGLTFLMWVLPWVHGNGVCFPFCPGPWEARGQDHSLFTFVVPWRFRTLTSALASLHSPTRLGVILIPTEVRFFGDMAGLKSRKRWTCCCWASIGPAC